MTNDLLEIGIARASFDSLERFLNACEALGQILSLEDVSLVAGSRRHVSSPYSIPFHSDGPAADVVAWFCIRQDDDEGESLLMDSIPALRSLNPESRDQLASVNIPYFDHSSPGRPSGYCPILRGDREREWRINYAPWLLPELTDSQRMAIAAFEDSISNSVATKIRLEPNQCLFIDNWRILHARGPLKSGSQRHLKRAWLRTSRTSRVETIALNPKESVSKRQGLSS
jgi:alpha-ketoglutarate-dependent taurine dioxygenase